MLKTKQTNFQEFTIEIQIQIEIEIQNCQVVSVSLWCLTVPL